MKFNWNKTRTFLKTAGMRDMLAACLFVILAQVFPGNHHSDDWFNGVASGFCTGIAFSLVVTAMRRAQEGKPDSPLSDTPSNKSSFQRKD